VSEKIYVTSAEVEAARAIVERNAASGKATPDAVRKIADAIRIEVGKHGKSGAEKGRSSASRGSAWAKGIKGLARAIKKHSGLSSGSNVYRSPTAGRLASRQLRKARAR
jgi:hypothetical protein